MKDNDLSAAPTHRYWVTAESVFMANVTLETKKTGWFHTLQRERIAYVPDLRILSLLWQWSSRLGVRMELIFFGDLSDDAMDLWALLDAAANPFNDYHVYGSINAAVEMLPYRPDILGVVDQPDRVLMWGSKGLTTGNLH